MAFIIDNIKWIMLVSGLLTMTMIFAAIAPKAALNATFGEAKADGAALEIVTRNWGVLITLIGAMLVYGAFTPPLQSFILIVAGTSKLAFIALILANGSAAARAKAAGAIVLDTIFVALFALYRWGRADRPHHCKSLIHRRQPSSRRILTA
jgi:hypothetical protein